MSSTELEAFLAELEPDIRAADRDMREIEMLEKKGVTAAGKLPGASPMNSPECCAHVEGSSSSDPPFVASCGVTDYEPLKPRLEKLIDQHQENAKAASVLERRVASLIHRYASQVSKQLFLLLLVQKADHSSILVSLYLHGGLIGGQSFRTIRGLG